MLEVRCNAPGKFHHYKEKICGKMGAQPKITQKMVGKEPPDYKPQPRWLCKDHWGRYPEVNGMTGERKPARRFPA